jgi:hypothetical protein
MQSLRPDLKREGIVVANNRELAELAGPRWAVSSTLYFLYNIRFVYVCVACKLWNRNYREKRYLI